MGGNMKLYNISDNYIKYISEFDTNVLSSHEEDRIYGRPYIGIVIQYSELNYFIPLSSPANTDYTASGNIKPSTTTIKRIISNQQLLGKLRINNMIPVPDSEIIPIDFSHQNKTSTDIQYLHLLNKQRIFLNSIQDEIKRDANAVYKQKIMEKNSSYWKNGKLPGYLDSTVNFLVLEEKCKEWSKNKMAESKEYMNEKELLLKVQKIRYEKENLTSLLNQKFECKEGKFQILELKKENAQVSALLLEIETGKILLEEKFASSKPLKLQRKEANSINKNSKFATSKSK